MIFTELKFVKFSSTACLCNFACRFLASLCAASCSSFPINYGQRHRFHGPCDSLCPRQCHRFRLGALLPRVQHIIAPLGSGTPFVTKPHLGSSHSGSLCFHCLTNSICEVFFGLIACHLVVPQGGRDTPSAISLSLIPGQKQQRLPLVGLSLARTGSTVSWSL